MTPLPSYAATDEGRALLAAIRIEQPECFYLKRYAWVNARYPRYQGHNARALRRLWEAAREAAIDANDREAFARLTNDENPDDLIHRLLAEPEVPFDPMELKELPGGGHRVAA